MPPIRRMTKSASQFKRNVRANLRREIRARRKPKNYNKRLNNFQSNSRNMLQIRTLIPKEILVDIQYRTQIIFDTMGYSASTGQGCSGTILRISLNKPTQGNTLGSSPLNIVDVVSLGAPFTDPVFTRTNSSQLNLSAELDPYFEQYRKAVVVESNSKVRVAAIPNQKELGQVFYNGSAQGAQGDSYPYNTNHMPFLAVKNAEADGDMYVWSIKQKTTGQLTQAPVPSFHDLRTKVPGIKMKNLRAYKDGHVSPGVMSAVSHKPSTTWSIKDWRDNIAECGFVKSNQIQPNLTKNAYHYVGICNANTPLIGNKPAKVKVDVVVNYKCRFVDRANNPAGGDDPLPQPVHFTEL